MNKLTICVYPMATIRPEVSGITGLDNYNLSGQATFDKETGQLLNIFLERLPKPLCLVAHNGDSYDFPLLKAELEKQELCYHMIPCVLILMLVLKKFSKEARMLYKYRTNWISSASETPHLTPS